MRLRRQSRVKGKRCRQERLPAGIESFLRLLDGIEARGLPGTGLVFSRGLGLGAAVVPAMRLGLFLRGAIPARRAEDGDGEPESRQKASPVSNHCLPTGYLQDSSPVNAVLRAGKGAAR